MPCGVLAKNHEYGYRMLMDVLDASKSSMYAYPASPIAFWWPGISCANSPFIMNDDGALASRNGILSSRLVIIWLSRLYAIFAPHIVLEIGSSPAETLVVSGFSLRCITVAPTLKSLLNAYSRCVPSNVLRCMLNNDWLSSETSIDVPDSIMD